MVAYSTFYEKCNASNCISLYLSFYLVPPLSWNMAPKPINHPPPPPKKKKPKQNNNNKESYSFFAQNFLLFTVHKSSYSLSMLHIPPYWTFFLVTAFNINSFTYIKFIFYCIFFPFHLLQTTNWNMVPNHVLTRPTALKRYFACYNLFYIHWTSVSTYSFLPKSSGFFFFLKFMPLIGFCFFFIYFSPFPFH